MLPQPILSLLLLGCHAAVASAHAPPQGPIPRLRDSQKNWQRATSPPSLRIPSGDPSWRPPWPKSASRQQSATSAQKSDPTAAARDLPSAPPELCSGTCGRIVGTQRPPPLGDGVTPCLCGQPCHRVLGHDPSVGCDCGRHCPWTPFVATPRHHATVAPPRSSHGGGHPRREGLDGPATLWKTRVRSEVCSAVQTSALTCAGQAGTVVLALAPLASIRTTWCEGPERVLASNLCALPLGRPRRIRISRPTSVPRLCLVDRARTLLVPRTTLARLCQLTSRPAVRLSCKMLG